MLPLNTALISFVLYVFAYLGIRSVGVMFIALLFITSIGYSIYKKIRFGDSFGPALKSSGLVYFIIMIVLTWAITRGFVFNGWDEFSHWGLVLKNLFASDNFGNLSNSTLQFKSYPQGISLFLNFFTHFSNIFNESNALRGILILSFAQLVIIFANIGYRDWKKILLISIILLVMPLVFFDYYYSVIFVDAIIGLIFGNILYFNFSYRKKDLFYCIYMSLQLYLLTNTKQIGILLTLIAFSAVLADFIYSNKIKNLKLFLAQKKQELVYLFIPILVGILTAISWKLFLGYHNIAEAFQITGLKLHDILSVFGSEAAPYREVTRDNFVRHLFMINQHGAVFYSQLLLTLFISLTMYLIYKHERDSQRSFTFQAITLLGLVVYAGMLLFLYLFAFSPFEAQQNASIDRYFGTYYLGLLTLTVFTLIDYFSKRKGLDKHLSNFSLSLLLVVLLCTIPMSNFVNNVIFSSGANDARRIKRAPYDNEVIKYSNLLDSRKDRVYIISQDTTGEDYWILRYDFSPVRVSENFSWSLGTPKSPEDLWTRDIKADGWSQELKQDYTYVYLYKVDDKFINGYGRLFESSSDIKEKNIYKIDKTNSVITLKRVAI